MRGRRFSAEYIILIAKGSVIALQAWKEPYIGSSGLLGRILDQTILQSAKSAADIETPWALQVFNIAFVFTSSNEIVGTIVRRTLLDLFKKE